MPATPRVLICDDSPLLRRVLSDMLTDGGMTVAGEARDGVELVEQVEALRPDVVTLDVEMPRRDGLDGLAIMPVVMVGSALGVFAYVTGSSVYSKYLLFPHIPGSGELLIFCSAMAGAGLAFLWFNTHPAQVFMGDVGALALGGALGTIAVIVRQEIVLAIMGGIFVVEALSVMMQVTWFKYTKKKYGEGRRVFKMAPLHHHFEKSGWPEPKVIVRFWILSVLLAMAGLATLKLR